MIPDRNVDTCVCGRSVTPIDTELVLRRQALGELPRVMRALMARDGVPKALVLFDQTTHTLFGDRVLAPVRAAGLSATEVVLGSPALPFEPDETAVKHVRETVGEQKALLVGVGSGAVNDLGKYVSAELGLPYVSVATAPSMDGFAAPISAIVVNRVKTTVPSRCPDAVVGDVEILAGAPAAMVSAGFGDVLGKLTSLTDWRLAYALFDEYWCAKTDQDVGSLAERVKQLAPAIQRRQPEAVGGLMEALVRAGTSVVHVGYSRPTSGAEHLISHFVEMWSNNRQARPPAHGHTVAVGTLTVCRIAEALKSLEHPQFPKEWEQEAPERVLDALKIEHVPSNFGMSKFDASLARSRVEQISARWPQALEILARLPSADEVRSVLEVAGCPTSFAELGLDAQTARQTVSWARYLRERYTMLDLAADLGVLPGLIDQLAS